MRRAVAADVGSPKKGDVSTPLKRCGSTAFRTFVALYEDLQARRVDAAAAAALHLALTLIPATASAPAGHPGPATPLTRLRSSPAGCAPM